MAINTALKRRAISGVPILAAGITPTAAKNQNWRFAAGLSYPGGYLYGINSAEKRRAITGLLPFLPVGVTPNAAQDVYWRVQAGWGYSIISLRPFDAPAVRSYAVIGETRATAINEDA